MKTILLLPLGLLAVFSAHAAVYTCADEDGNKSISDKPCPPAQTTQRVQKSTHSSSSGSSGSSYRQPGGDDGAAEDAGDLEQQLDALFGGQPGGQSRQGGADPAPSGTAPDSEATRQMKAYLRVRGQQTQ